MLILCYYETNEYHYITQNNMQKITTLSYATCYSRIQGTLTSKHLLQIRSSCIPVFLTNTENSVANFTTKYIQI
jgi:hypothetical protein